MAAQNGHRVFERRGRRIYGRSRAERSAGKNVEAGAGAFHGDYGGNVRRRNVEISGWTKASSK